jgi:hypothetical protein
MYFKNLVPITSKPSPKLAFAFSPQKGLAVEKIPLPEILPLKHKVRNKGFPPFIQETP